VQSMDAAGIPLPGMRPDFTAIAQLATELGAPVPHDVKPLRKHLSAAHPFFATMKSGVGKGLRLA
jgi:hypothetical protein